MTIFGKTLLFLREKDHVTKETLAEAVGMPLSMIENLESGYIEPDAETATKIAKYFGVTAGYMRGSAGVY